MKIFPAAIILLFSCNTADFKPQKADTIRVWVLYQNPTSPGGGFDPLWRVTKDTFAIDINDSTKNIWRRDTFYYFPVSKVDSLNIDSVTRQPKQRIEHTIMPKDYIIHDFNKKAN